MKLEIKNVPKKYDVIVVGGGPAGVAAAVASARLGANTLIIEGATALGGMATVGMVSRLTTLSDGEKIIYHSLCTEIMDRYMKEAGVEPDFRGRIPLITEDLKLVLDDIVTEAGAHVLFQSTVCAVEMEGDNIASVIVANKAGLTPYVAHVYVDATGDGDVAYFAGVPYEKGDDEGDLQPASLCFAFSNTHSENKKGSLNGGKDTVWSVIGKDDNYPLVRNHFVPVHVGNGTIFANAGHLDGVDSTDPESVSEAYIKGRRIAKDYLKAAKAYIPEVFGPDALLIATAPMLGVRESRRMEAEYQLTTQDYIDRKSFDDEVCRNHNWLDCHTRKGKPNPYKLDPEQKYKDGDSHGIPWRCQVPKKVDNLVLSGRCIWNDRGVFSSTRVMPNCFATGEAAGIAAALAVKKNCGIHALDAREIISHIKK
ncbi:MAG: FAD-dependent oxidoreductase [Clostridia bacterium]|nr:FAD-dependent oxidoreductase [Clostridia bacterium]